MTIKERAAPVTMTRRRFLSRGIWLGTALMMMPLWKWFRLRRVTQRELSLSEADLYGPHGLAG